MLAKPIFDFDTEDTRWDIAEKLKVVVENNPDLCRAIRRHAKLSQKQLAYELGCSQATISQIERGAYFPSCDFAVDYLLVLSSSLPPDDSLIETMSEDDTNTLYNLHFYCKESLRMEKLRHDRRKTATVDLSKLKVVLEGESGTQEFGQTCKWPDCGWTWYPDGLSDPHSGTCPLAD